MRDCPYVPNVDHLSSCSMYQDWLDKFLFGTGWHNDTLVASAIVNTYECFNGTSSKYPVELAFESFSADYGMTCGNDLIVEMASKHFASSTYRSHLVAPPSHPYGSGDRVKHFAFHTWDYPITEAGMWDSGFVPRKADEAVGAALRASWRAMLHDEMNNFGFMKGGCTQIATES
jgi:hypothetical protein